MHKRIALALLGTTLAFVSTQAAVLALETASKEEVVSDSAEEPVIGLGTPIDAKEVERLSITIFPDGKNLPEGSGNVGQGKTVYVEQCTNCHGERGIEGPASRLVGSDGFFSPDDPDRMARIRKYPLLMISVGAQWPYATTIFDHVRRAMPHVVPKSLTNDQVYAVTAYILYLNGIVEEDTTLTRENLPKVKMPGAARTVMAWPEEKSATEE